MCSSLSSRRLYAARWSCRSCQAYPPSFSRRKLTDLRSGASQSDNGRFVFPPARDASILQTSSPQRSCRSRVRSVLLRASLTSLLESWVHIPMLEDFFQIRPYAQIRDVIGDARKSMRHALRNDDDVSRLYLMARVSNHCAAAGRAVQDCRDLVLWRRTPPVYDCASSNQRRAARYDDVTLGRIVVENAGGTCHIGTLLAACHRRVRRRAGIGSTTTTGVRVHTTAASHRPAVDDGDSELIVIHVDHSDRIIRTRALCIGGVLQHDLDVPVADVHAILWCLSQPDYRTCRKHDSQGL